jgi:hypothetical protein
MKLSRLAPIAAAVLFAFACDNSSDLLSPKDKPSLDAGGNDNNQRAEGVVVSTDGTAQYTFTAFARKGEFSGHVSWELHDGFVNFGIEGDVTCLVVEPGTRHAIVRGIVTSSNHGGEGTYFGFNVTDGGNGSKASPDAGSVLHATNPGECALSIPEQTNDQTNVSVKP